MEHPLLQMTSEEQQMQGKLLLASNLPQQIRGPLRREPGLTRRKKQRRRGWRHLFQSPGNLIIPRLGLIVLST
jgi:hypothetical protein